MDTYYGTNRDDIFDGGRRDERVYGYGGNDDLFGFAGDDFLIGGDGDDLLVGGVGNDRLSGGAGSDLLAGEAGNDVLNGGGGFDYADYFYAASGVSVDLATGIAADGDGGRDRLAAIEGVFGSRHADTLRGNAAVNELFGDDGDDVLIGGAGQDLTVGGQGADRFVFAPGDVANRVARADLIGDFSRAEGDRIDLSAFDANTATTTDDGFVFIGSAAFGGVAGELRFANINGETVLMGDVDGDRVADAFIRLDDQQALIATDFVL